MDTFETIQTLLAVRTFQEKAIPPDAVRRIVEAGWLTGSSAWGRPVDVLELPDGSLLVSDDAADTIYRITYSAP